MFKSYRNGKKVVDFTVKSQIPLKLVVLTISMVLLLGTIAILPRISADSNTRSGEENGPSHSNQLVHLVTSQNTTDVIIVTSGHGPLTGISPIQEKNYWLSILSSMPDFNVDWYDGIPSFNLLNQYDLVIYDAGGYWYPLSLEVNPLWDYHFTGKPLIVVAPDINYDWNNIKYSSKPYFCENVLHMDGVLGILPEVGFDVIADTGHPIIYSVPTDVNLPVSVQSSWPDCFDPSNDCDGVLTQWYISGTEFGVGSCSGLPSYSPYNPQGSLFSVIAYPGSNSEGRVVTYGFPLTALEDNDILDIIAEATINWACEMEIKQIDLTLFVEDALQPEDTPPIVNKAPGDLVDIISIIKNNEDSILEIDVSISLDYATLNKCFMRNDFTYTDEDNVLTWDQDGNTWSTNIELDPDESTQVVWRFEISDTIPTNIAPIASGKVLVEDQVCGYTTTSFSMSAFAKGIIVTNRHLLYDRYDDEEVKSLLIYLYQMADDENCIIYYVDHYNDTSSENIMYWDQDVDFTSENTANTISNEIDDLIEDWAEESALVIPLLFGFELKIYPYLVIVGSDETVPFYRVDFTGYPEEHYNSADPVLDTYDHDYFLTDMKYADMDDTDWTQGSINLASGRIVGATAEDMKNLIENGLESPTSDDNAIVSMIELAPSFAGEKIQRLKEEKGLNILNDGKSIVYDIVYDQKYDYDFGVDILSQEGIASNDNGIFFITSFHKLFVAELNGNTGNFDKIDEYPYNSRHFGDPFCDNDYLFVPWSNWNGIIDPDEAKCYVYHLSDLSQVSGSPFDLKKNGNYLISASSGAYYNGYYYFSTFFPKDQDSHIYKFSFDVNDDDVFKYEKDYSLGKKEVQGIEFLNDKCYFIRAHGKDPNVYWIDAQTWDTNNIGVENLQTPSGNTNGPYEGMTFDTSENNKCIAFFGFGPHTFESFEFLSNDEEPITFEIGGNDDWDGSDLINLMENNNYCIWHYTGHSDYWEFSTNPDIESDGELANNANLINKIGQNHPLFTTVGCHSGVITDENGIIWNPDPDDNLAWALVHAGCSGYLAQLSYGQVGETDLFFEEFYESFVKTDTTQTNPVGTSLRNAVIAYDPGASWSVQDEVAVTEPILYGIPWMTMDPANNPPLNDNKDFSVDISIPEQISDNTYKISIEIDDVSYSLSELDDGTQMINIEGSDLLLDPYKPKLPFAKVELEMPYFTQFEDLSSIEHNYNFIGQLDIAKHIPMEYSEYPIWGGDPIPLGDYPSLSCWGRMLDFGTNKKLEINVPLATYDLVTNGTYILENIKMEIIYQTPITAVITEFYPDKSEYDSSETIHATTSVENVGSDTLTDLQAELRLIDKFGEIKESIVTSLFNINSGEEKTLQIELDQNLLQGTYLLLLNIIGSGTLASASEYIHISSGNIIAFIHPDKVIVGEDIEFEILFKNNKESGVEATGVVYIYDSYGIEVAKLPSLTVTVGPSSTESIIINWNTLGKELGKYTAAAMINTDDESYGPLSDTFSIIPPDFEPPITIKTIGTPKYGEHDEWVTSNTEFNLFATDDNSGVDETYYRIWYMEQWTVWMKYIGNFTLAGEGKHYIEYYSIDNAGNVEEVHNQTHYVDDTPPQIVNLILPADPIQIDTPVELNAIFFDQLYADAHSATIDWGDGNITSRTVDEINQTITGNWSYAQSGVYAVNLTVEDYFGRTDWETFQYVVVYDPGCGFATGGGWINSPEEAYTSDPSLTGKANFGFVSKYKKGHTIPTGNTQFNFQEADLNFHSDNYLWMMIVGPYAIYKGTGTINNDGDYDFIVTVFDGGDDMFGIKIWDNNNEDEVIYDSGLIVLGGGQIKIHN